VRNFKTVLVMAVSSLVLSACGGGNGGSAGGVRDNVRVVGSSTVYPFATAIAEAAAKASGIKIATVESTGTGAGMKLFCAGVGTTHPDVETASRRMKASEYADCAKNGVKDVVEIQIGLDGIAFASAKGGMTMPLTAVDVYKALAANPFGKPNTSKTWKDVNPALPATPISVYGPPSTSGTRDALKELILAKGCDSDPAMKLMKKTDEKAHKKICEDVRSDGAYVEQGENDNLIVQKIASNPKAIGIFGFSFLEENMDKLQGLTMSGVSPTYATISDFSYPGARPLYIYAKAAHLKSIKGLQDYANAFAAEWGPEGLLKKKGMVIAPEDVRAANAEIVKTMKPLDPSQLK
jgi:phosphate transport system substrate-binding protein